MSGASQISWDEVGKAPQQGAPQISWDKPDPELPKVTTSTNPKAMMAVNAAHDIDAHPIRSEIAGGIGAAGAGLMGAEALGETPLIGPALKWGARKLAPIAVPAAASYAINKARSLPVVGPIINHIPFAEMLPWLASGKGKEAEAEGAPGEPDVYSPGYRTPRSYHGGQAPEPIPSRPGLQLEGETAQPIEGEYVDSPAAQPGKQIPTINATQVGERGAEPTPAPYRKVGGIEPEDVGTPDPNVLAHRGGVIVRKPVSRGLALTDGKPEPIADAVTSEAASSPEPEASTPIAKPAPKAGNGPRGITPTGQKYLDRMGKIASTFPAQDAADAAASQEPAAVNAPVESRPMFIGGQEAEPGTDLTSGITPEYLQQIARRKAQANAQPIQ